MSGEGVGGFVRRDLINAGVLRSIELVRMSHSRDPRASKYAPHSTNSLSVTIFKLREHLLPLPSNDPNQLSTPISC